jgi:epoxyqueuosine reductase
MSPFGENQLSHLIKARAFALNFDLCGIAPVRELREYAQVLKSWLGSGMNGDMNFFAKTFDERINPSLIFDEAKSLVVVGLNYFAPKKQGGNGIPLISSYAYGIDYHNLIKEKLNHLLDFITSVNPEARGKSFVDAAPIIEKAWAREAGLGWFGKNSLILNKEIGSFFFIGELVLNIELDYESPFTGDYCGNCRICIDSCPTGAINYNRTIDVRKCLSYLTVENKNAIPEEFSGKMEERIFGCDKCQDVCPWNKNVKPHNIPGFDLSPELAKMTREDWLSLSEKKYKKLFGLSAVRRVKYERLMDNIKFVTRTIN